MDFPSVQPPSFAAVPVDTPTQRETISRHRELIQAVRALNKSEMFGQDNELTFVFDRNSHRPLLRIINRETKEVIQQIPPEHALRLAEELPSPPD